MYFAQGNVLEFAHELKNQLTFLKASCHVLSRRPDGEDSGFSHHLNMMKETIHAIEAVLLKLKPSPEGHSHRLHQVTEIGALVLEALSPWREGLRQKRIYLEEKIIPRPCYVLGDVERLKLAFRNLIINASEAMPNGGRLRISVELRRERVKVLVLDSGNGIPKEVLSRFGEPSISTKSHGMGLGLHLSLQIIREHQGSLRVKTGSWGTCFLLCLPLAKRNFPEQSKLSTQPLEQLEDACKTS